MNILYIKGDATIPFGNGNKVITHICNNVGGWGRGFVLALSQRWKLPEEAYRQYQTALGYHNRKLKKLGKLTGENLRLSSYTCVANMIGQNNLSIRNGVPPIRYDAVQACLKKVADFALQTQSSVHMPRIGCGLAGGKWEIIEKIINEELISKNISVTVYDLV